MKHLSIRQIFAYWDHRRGERIAPDRNEIEPAAIRTALGDSIILAGDSERNLAFRLAGTRVCALFCRELKGELFIDLWAMESRPMLRDIVSAVMSEGIGIVAGVSARAESDLPVDLELLLLPLSFQQNLRRRMLGALAPIGAPYWLGIRPLGPLKLGAFRHLGPAITTTPRLLAGAESPRMNRRFVVYDGGLR